MEKVFHINTKRRGQYIYVQGMGRIMFRPEADEIVARFGSTIRREPGDNAYDIIPPIGKDRLPALGAALVELARQLDPTEPGPTYTIN